MAAAVRMSWLQYEAAESFDQMGTQMGLSMEALRHDGTGSCSSSDLLIPLLILPQLEQAIHL